MDELECRREGGQGRHCLHGPPCGQENGYMVHAPHTKGGCSTNDTSVTSTVTNSSLNANPQSQAPKRALKAVKRFIKSRARHGKPSAKPLAQAATIEGGKGGCPLEVVSSESTTHPPSSDLRRLHREAAIYPRTPCLPGLEEWTDPVTWPNPARRSPQSSILAVLDIRAEDPVEIFDGSALQVALSEEPSRDPSVVVPDVLSPSGTAPSAIPPPAESPMLTTTPHSPNLHSRLGLSSLAGLRRLLPHVNSPMFRSVPNLLASDPLSDIYVPSTTPLAPLFCDRFALHSPASSISSAPDATICYASSASAAEASLCHGDHELLARSLSVPNLRDLEEGADLYSTSSGVEDDDDGAGSTTASTGCAENAEADGLERQSIWEMSLMDPSTMGRTPLDPEPENPPTSLVDPAALPPQSNAGSTPLDPCFQKPPVSAQTNNTLNQYYPSKTVAPRPAEPYHLPVIGWVFPQPWLVRPVDKRAVTEGDRFRGSLYFYKLPNATFVSAQSSTTTVSSWREEIDKIIESRRRKGFDNDEISTTPSSPTLSAEDSVHPDMPQMGDLDSVAQARTQGAPYDMGPSDDETDDGEPTWEVVWEDYVRSLALKDKEAWNNYLRGNSLKKAKDSEGECAGDPSWDEVWRNHLKEAGHTFEGTYTIQAELIRSV